MTSVKQNTTHTGFFGKIDPLLIYTLTESKITEIKNQTSAYFQRVTILNNEINTLSSNINQNSKLIAQKKSEIYTIYKSLFTYLQPYIENESFDQNMFNSIKESYI